LQQKGSRSGTYDESHGHERNLLLCSMELNMGPVDWCPGIDTANVPTFVNLRIDTLNKVLAEPEIDVNIETLQLVPRSSVREVWFAGCSQLR
jgi:hypothetical protein